MRAIINNLMMARRRTCDSEQCTGSFNQGQNKVDPEISGK